MSKEERRKSIVKDEKLPGSLRLFFLWFRKTQIYLEKHKFAEIRKGVIAGGKKNKTSRLAKTCPTGQPLDKSWSPRQPLARS